MSAREFNRVQSSPEISVTDSHPGGGALPRTITEPAPQSKSNLSIPQATGGTEQGTPSRPPLSPLTPKPLRHKKIHVSSVDWSNTLKFDNGRVLIIDYLRQADAKLGKTVIAHREFAGIAGLERFYRNRYRSHEAALRVIHVQNAPWATPLLLRKYNILPRDELIGTNFGKWVWSAVPELRGGKPWLKGRVWRTQKDPWRLLRRTHFSVDYYKKYESDESNDQDPLQDQSLKVMELNHFDDDGMPSSGVSVYGQRLSVYIQHLDPDIQTPPDDVRNPYLPRANGNANGQTHKPSITEHNFAPSLEELDNGSTVIVWEKSVSGSIKDTLLTARDQIESRWRRLSFFLPREDIDTDDRLGLQGINYVVSDIFRSLAYNWEKFLSIAEAHVGALEDKVYDSPADETRAPELWRNASNWLKVEKVCNNHMDVLKELKLRLSDLTESHSPPEKWLDGVSAEFEKVANLIQEDLVKPTANLNDLLYKSVGIRDSRHGLQLNTSLWRLSWITFIFLPLTFVVGFFGMNVGTFESYPSIKWYFVAAIVLMVLVVVLWYVFKHMLQARRYTPYQRGIYEHLYQDLASARPDLWTRRGPRRHIKPLGMKDRFKWRLARYWFMPEKTIAQRHGDPDEDAGGSGLGAWARIKRKLVRHWLTNLKIDKLSSEEMAELALSERVEEEGGVLKTLAGAATAAATAETVPLKVEGMAPQPITKLNLEQLSPPISPQLKPGIFGTGPRPSSSGAGSSDGMIVEERDFDDKEDEDAPWTRSWRRSADAIFGSLSDRRSQTP